MSERGLFCVRFEPHGKQIFVPAGTVLAEAAAKAGLALEQACGGRGQCGRCRVIIREPLVEPSVHERKFFVAEELEEGWRLACQTLVLSDMVVEIPLRSLAGGQAQILADFRLAYLKAGDPPLRKVPIEFSPAQLASETALLTHIESVLGPLVVPLPVLRKLGEIDPQANPHWIAVIESPETSSAAAQLVDKGRDKDGASEPGWAHQIDGNRLPAPPAFPCQAFPMLMEIEPDDTPAQLLGVAFDIGTTTIVANLVDLGTGEIVAVASDVNPQIRFGEDVISRIQLCRQQKDGTQLLCQAVRTACANLLGLLCTQSAVKPESIYVASFAGNTTMLHLLAGVNPASLGQAPFRPIFQRELFYRAEELGLPIHPRGQVYILPIIGPFVGGDTVAGMLAVRLWERPSPALLVDIGTNGEIVLSHQGRLIATATAAGPAFEGTRIRCGMRAVTGAIERVMWNDGELAWEVIGGQRPAGLCGSGLVDVLALLLRSGIVTTSGRMLTPEEAAERLPAGLCQRVLRVEGRPAFEVVSPHLSASGQAIVLTQQDVRQLQLAAGAIRAGVTILCRTAGVSLSELQEVWVAGAFGNYLRPASAQAIGLLPREIPPERIRFAGNTSLAGATLAAVSLEARATARWLAATTQHLELAVLPEFRQAFAEGMIFPDPA